MGDLASLLLVLVLVYGTECLMWVRRGTVVFRTTCSHAWRVVSAWMVLAHQQHGPVLGNPLPPLGTVLPCPPWLVSLAPEAVYAYVATALTPGGRRAQEGVYVRFTELRHVTVDAKDVFINDALFVRADSAQLARHLAAVVRQLATLSIDARSEAIEAVIATGLNSAEVAQRVEDYRWQTAALRCLENILFLYLFVGVPLVVWWQGRDHTALWLGAGFLVLIGMTLSEYYRAHQALYPPDRGDRLSHLVFMILSPPMIMRAHDLLSQHLLGGYHPLAVAQVLCASSRFRAFAAWVLRDIRFPLGPLCPTEACGPCGAEQWFRARVRAAIEQFLLHTGLDPETLLMPPTPDDDSCRTYCPRCQCQYTVVDGACTDCGGAPLQPL